MGADEGGGSVAFDRVADRYDATRALPPEAEQRMVELLVPELLPHGPVLEVGVGTGRVARPLAGAGVRLMGIDLSEPMLRRLVANAGGTRPFPLARADATRLPFADASFGAATLVHVLHLVPAWTEVLAELRRVVRPGGCVVTSLGVMEPMHREIIERFSSEAGIERPFVGLRQVDGQWTGWDHDDDRIVAAMADLGARRRDLGMMTVTTEETIDGFLRQAVEGVWSWTWSATPEQRAHAARAIRPWAEERFGDLAARRRITTNRPWVAFDLE